MRRGLVFLKISVVRGSNIWGVGGVLEENGEGVFGGGGRNLSFNY